MNIRYLLAPIAGLAALAALSGCGSPDVTKSRLEGATQQEFVNLYLKQAAILGDTRVTRQTMAPQTTCDRGGPKVADVGPGSDWICHTFFIDGKGVRQDGKLEVQARANACYTATAPSRITGPIKITGVDGKDHLNPVFEFDGCYNPRSS